MYQATRRTNGIAGRNGVISVGVRLAVLGLLGIVTLSTLTPFIAKGIAAPVQEGTALQGKPAPDFTLPDQNDHPVKLADSRGKWVVLAFYLADMSGGCTIENRSFSSHLGDFKSKNAVIYTISTQDTASKKQFVARDGLKHTLLADVGGKVAKAYGALMEGTTYTNRWTYYISPDGTVAFVDTKVKVGTAAEDALATLDKLEKGK